MKKVLLAAALVVSAFAASAQNAGKIYIGADLVNLNFAGLLDPRLTANPNGAPIFGLSTQSGNGTGTLKSRTTLGLNVEGGYFFSENMAFGLGLGFTNMSQSDTSGTGTPNGNIETKTSSTTFTIMPYLRYMKPVVGKWSLMADAGISFSTNSGKVEDPTPTTGSTTETSGGSFGIFVRPGFAYAMTDKWTIFGNMKSNLFGFTSNFEATTKTTPIGGTTTETKTPASSSMTLDLNPISSLTVGLGLFYSFGGSK